MPSVVISPTIDRARGVLAAAKSDRRAAEPPLRAALERFTEIDVPFEIAQTQERLAAQVEEPERAELLSAALAGYEALGARPFADRVRASLAEVASPSSLLLGGSSLTSSAGKK